MSSGINHNSCVAMPCGIEVIAQNAYCPARGDRSVQLRQNIFIGAWVLGWQIMFWLTGISRAAILLMHFVA